MKILSVDPKKRLEILNTYHTSHLTIGNIISHYYELFTTSILLKNIEIMTFLIGIRVLKVDIIFSKNAFKFILFNVLFYYRLTGDIENETKFLKFFKLSDCRDSYKEFISLIYLIYLYDTATSANKMNIKTSYHKLE